MKRMMIAVVIMAAFVFGPGSVFAAEDFNSSRSNLSHIIASATTQAKCKKAGGKWIVNAQGKGVCQQKVKKVKTKR